MNRDEVKELFSRYNRGTASVEERKLLENWYAATSITEQTDPPTEDYLLLKHEAWEAIHLETTLDKSYRLWPRIIVAAAVAIVIFGAGLFYFNAGDNQANADKIFYTNNDIAPGSVGATLILANGKKIKLVNAASGEIAKEAGTSITKTADGQLVYDIASQAGYDSSVTSLREQAKQSYNTLTTAKGETYILILPDKSKVWMNAASSLKYPTSFKGNERKVELTGEAYFVVRHNAKQPFRVETKDQIVEDIGTEFNISDYPDENTTKTTLVEGSVRVLRQAQHDIQQVQDDVVLKPGQQAILNNNKIVIETVDSDEMVAWKNGYFKFTDEDIQSVMRKIARWYDIDVQYEGKVSHKLFSGRISRFKNISQVLKMIESTKSIHFKVEERRIIVIQ